MVGRLATELQQTKPFESLGVEALLNVIRTASLLQAQIARDLKPHGLSHEQYNVLRILKGARAGGRTCQEVADRMISRDPDITRLVDKLVKKGLAVRERDTKDRRVVITRISKAGEALLKKVAREIRRPAESLTSNLTGKQLTQLINLLEKSRDGLE